MNRLFYLGFVEVFQDCEDFFIFLSEIIQHWFDVYSLFMVESVSFTSCSECNHVSSQDQSLSKNTFFLFECPNGNESMSSFVEKKLNNFETHWRNEDGCKRKTMGKTNSRIMYTYMNETQNLIFVIN